MDSSEQSIVHQIPFGLGSAIIEANPKEDLLREIKDRFNILINNYQSINPAHLERMKKYPHKFTINISDNYWFLYAFRSDDQACRVALIDRQNKKQYYINIHFGPEIYNGTLITGEIINNYFIAQDLLILNNRSRYYLEHNLDKRLSQLQTLLREKYTPDLMIDPIRFAIRPYWPVSALSKPFVESLIDSMKPFGVKRYRSIVFTPQQFYKFPNSVVYTLRTFDLNMSSTEDNKNINISAEKSLSAIKSLLLKKHSDISVSDIYEVFDTSGKKLLGLAYVGTRGNSEKLRQAFTDRKEIMFDCIFNTYFNKWEPLKEV